MFFIIIIFLAFLLEASEIFVIFNTRCNFLLIATVFGSLRLLPYKAGFFGCFCGLLLDCIGIRHLGINALSFTIIGILISMFSKRLYPRIDVIIFIIFLATLISGAISLFFTFLFEGFLLNIFSILKEALFNILFGGLISIFIRKRL